jgi:nucleotide-binding universal stress UspA family protein
MNFHPGSFPFERIVIGVDGTSRADCAVGQAVQFQREQNSRLECVHAVPLPRSNWPGVSPVRLATLNAAALTEAWRDRADHLAPILGIESPNGDRAVWEERLRVLPGKPTAVLLERAAHLDADLVMLGGHKRRPLIDFGGTARGVLAKSPTPVWVQPDEPQPIRRILAAVDLSEESLVTLDMAARLGRSLDAQVTVLHAFHLPVFAATSQVGGDLFGADASLSDLSGAAEERLATLVEGFDWGTVSHEECFVRGEPSDEILARQETTDLVILGTHGETALASTVLGSVAYTVLKSSSKPVLALHHSERHWLV